MAISGSYSTSDNPFCSRDLTDASLLLNCKFPNGTLKIITSNFGKVDMICETDTKEPVLIPSYIHKFSYINKEFSVSYLKLDDISIKNCRINSFGALIENFQIKEKILRFEGINIGSSLDGRFASGFENLKTLVLSNNNNLELNEHDFESLKDLSELDLSRNEIYELPENVFAGLTLSELDLSHNDMPELPENVFKHLKELKTLKLNSNKLQYLHPLMFTQQKQLNVLYLDNNRLHNLTREMFEGLDSLTVLTIDRNRFHTVKDDVFDNIPMLQLINFGNGNIVIPYNIFAKNYHLKYVKLLRVKIPNGLNLTSLETLRIKWSEIVNISGLSNIKTVYLTEGHVHLLDVNSFESQSGMTNLSLSSNELTDLNDGLFNGLKELISLQLSDNNLTNISG